MDEVRIKDLASASGQLAEFDAFEFIVDVPTAAASMKVSGKEIKGVMAPKKHTHAVSDITGLSGELDKKLDKKGGSISGDLSVMGDTYLRRLHLEEFLEVPEYRYNRNDRRRSVVRSGRRHRRGRLVGETDVGRQVGRW